MRAQAYTSFFSGVGFGSASGVMRVPDSIASLNNIDTSCSCITVSEPDINMGASCSFNRATSLLFSRVISASKCTVVLEENTHPSPTHISTRPSTHSHPSTHTLTPIHPHTHTHPPTHSHPSTHTLTSIHPHTHPPTHPSTHTLAPIHPHTHIHPPPHPSTHTLTPIHPHTPIHTTLTYSVSSNILVESALLSSCKEDTSLDRNMLISLYASTDSYHEEHKTQTVQHLPL